MSVPRPTSRRANRRAARAGASPHDAVAFPAPKPETHERAPARNDAPATAPAAAPVTSIRMPRPDTLIALVIAGVCFLVAGTLGVRMMLADGDGSTSAGQQRSAAPNDHRAPERAERAVGAPAAGRESAPAAPPAQNATPDETVAQDRPPSDPMGLLRTLRTYADDLRTQSRPEAETLGLVVQAFTILSDTWGHFDRRALHAANELVVEILHLAARDDEQAARLVDRIALPGRRLSESTRLNAHNVWSSAWSVGMLVRLSRERDLPATALSRIDERVHALSAIGFDDGVTDPFTRGALAALTVAPDLIAGADAGPASPRGVTGDPGAAEAWRRWMQAVDAIDIPDARTREELSLRAAGALLVGATRVGGVDQPTRTELHTMLDRAEWGDGSQGREALLRWLDDVTRISERELGAAMTWLIDNAPESGVGVDSLVNVRATRESRARARDRLAASWGLLGADASENTRDRWARAAREALEQRDDTGGVLAGVVDAAVLSRINEAAARLWRHEVASARAVLSGLRDPVEQAMRVAPSSGGRAVRVPSNDGEWALRFIVARRNAAERRRVIGQLVNRAGELGPADAGVLVNAAFFGSPADVRAAALRIAERRAEETWLVNAVLEELPRAPRVEPVARLVERVAGARLPPVRDRDWPRAARHALVLRLLARYDAGDDFATLDRLSAVLARSYEGWRPPSPGDEHAGTRDDPALAAAGAWATMRAQAAAISGTRGAERLAALERRRESRVAIAQGPVQAFIAQQTSVAEMLALVVAAERPERESEATAIIENLRDDAALAEDVYEQAAAGERAIARLWLLRFGAGGGS